MPDSSIPPNLKPHASRDSTIRCKPPQTTMGLDGLEFRRLRIWTRHERCPIQSKPLRASSGAFRMNSQCLFTQTVPAWPTWLCRQVTASTQAQLEVTVLCLQPVRYLVCLQGRETREVQREVGKTSRRSSPQPCQSPGSRWTRKGHSLERTPGLSRGECRVPNPPMWPSDGWHLPSELPPRHPARLSKTL